jgi:hypothetical protein
MALWWPHPSVWDVLEYLTKTLAGRDFSGFLDILVPWSAS